MDEPILFGSRFYLINLGLLAGARGADFLSTWIATPNLVLEANPLARMLRWKWGLVVNVIFCFSFAFWTLPTIIISTTSALVAARNFQVAWLMRAAGEEAYRHWVVSRLEETPMSLFLFCLGAQTVLMGGIGTAVVVFSEWRVVPLGIGMGIIAYAVTVLLFTTISLWRNRRALG